MRACGDLRCWQRQQPNACAHIWRETKGRAEAYVPRLAFVCADASFRRWYGGVREHYRLISCKHWITVEAARSPYDELGRRRRSMWLASPCREKAKIRRSLGGKGEIRRGKS